VSVFVVEAAASKYLEIDRSDLTFQPQEDKHDDAGEDTMAQTDQFESSEEYWAAVNYAKRQLYDYYGTGAHFCPAMYTILDEIKNWEPDKILEEAIRNGLI